jgi:hypothetical protein
MTTSDPIAEQLAAANPVPSVEFLKPTLNEANEFVAAVKGLDMADPAAVSPDLIETLVRPNPPLGAGSEVHRPDDVVEYLRLPERSAAPRRKNRWSGLVAALAATGLVVVGIVAITDRSNGDVVTDPALSVADPVASDGAVDPFSYRWSRVPHDEAVLGGAPGIWMQSVVSGGPGLVAVGSVGNQGDADAAVWTSLDGETWSRVPHDETTFGGTGGQWISGVTVFRRGLVAVGSDGRFNDENEASTADGWYEWGEQIGNAAVWTSVDGLNWSRVLNDRSAFGSSGDQQMASVTAAGPGLVAVGSIGWGDQTNAAVWTSADGFNWTVTVPDHEEILPGTIGHKMSSVIAAGPGLVAVGSRNGDAAVWTSIDGLSWSRVPHDEAALGGVGEQGMSSVTIGGPGLVAVGFDQPGDDVPTGQASDAAVWTSVDGTTWSRVPHDEVFGGTGNQRMQSVTATGAGLVAVGADGGYYDTRPNAVVWTSLDGLIWDRVAHDEAVFGGAEIHSVAVTGAGVVAVGDESLESRDSPSRQEALEAGDSVFVWLAELGD